MTDVTTGNGSNGKRFAFLLRAFSSRNYRLFFAGQFISLLGTWLTNVATSWLVNRITDDPVKSPRMLGWVNFAALMPAFVLAPFAGVMVDRWRKHRVLVWTQALSMLQSFGLAAVAFLMVRYAGSKPAAESVPVILAWLIALAMFQGLINAFDVPTRQSFVVKLIDRREDLSNGIALNSSMFNLARLIGPAVAGVLIWKVGEAWCFTIDGFSYVAVIIALLMMRVNEDDRPKEHRHVLVELREGVAYASGFAPIRDILLVLAMTSFAVTPCSILMPRFATEVLHGDARTQGLLTSAVAAGALLGALRMAARKSVVGLGGQMPWVAVGQGTAMILFGLSHARWLSFACLVLAGFCTMTMMATGNTLLQTLVEDRMRGRIMSLFTVAVIGMSPLGALAAGQAAARVGPMYTVMGGGVMCIIAGMIFALRVPALRKLVRPIYVKRGILPETAQGLAAAEGVLEEKER